MQKKKTSLPRRILKSLLVLAILSGVGGGGYWYYQKSQTIKVKTTKIGKGLFLYTITSTSTGTLKADRITKVSSRINGRVIKVNFDEGDRVEKEAELVALDPEEALANIKMAEANLSLAKVRYEQARVSYDLEKKLVHSRIQETEANLKEAESALKRARNMIQEKIYSDQQLDTSIRNFDVAKAAHDSALANREGLLLKKKEVQGTKAEEKQLEEALQIARIQANYLTIQAPFQGILSLKDVEVGEMVLPGETLAEIVDDGSIYIHAPIDEADIYKLKVGQTVKVAIDSFPNTKFTGRLYEISPIVSEEKQEGRTVSIKVSIDSHEEVLRPGMSCDIEILVDEIPGALLVPTNLLMGRGNKKHVFVIEGNRVKKKPVTLGLSNWDFSVVKEGLREGDEIISSIDILNLAEGSRVVVENQ